MLIIGVVIAVFKVIFVTRFKKVVSGEVVEKAVIVRTLTIF